MRLKRLDRLEADVKQYLLGQLSEAEQARVEQRVFASDRSHEELLAFEEDLIDAFVAGELTAEERARFESHFLTSERRAQKVATARALAAGLNADPREASVPVTDSLGHRWWMIAAASLAIVMVGWFAFRDGRGLFQEVETRQPSASVVSPPAAVIPPTTDPAGQSNDATSSPDRPGASGQAPRVRPAPSPAVALILVPGAPRDIAGGVRLVIPPNTDVVVVDVRFEPADYRRFTAVLRTVGDRVVRTDASSQARAVAHQMSITLRWPAELAADDYILTLTGETSSGRREEIADYYFRVVRPRS